jgi:hypothetical protein
MQKSIIYLIIIIILVAIILYNINENMDSVTQNTERKFKIIFSTNWGTPGTENNINFPTKQKNGEDSHTGNMCLITHNDKYSAFKLGDYANQGIIESSEYGKNDSLITEIINEKQNCFSYYTAPVLNTPGKAIFDITINPQYPYISFVTMIAPSSNWFTGISSVNLTNVIEPIRIPTYAYDAGADYGTEFRTLPKHPRGEDVQPIMLLNCCEIFPIKKDTIPAFGYIEIIPQ